MKKLLLLLLCGNGLLFAQTAKQISIRADSLYKTDCFFEAAVHYRRSADMGWLKPLRTNGYYNAACSFALAGDTDHAFENLNLLIFNGYSKKTELENDCDLDILHNDKRWTKIMASIKRHVGENPHNAKFITSDITNFYRAFDLAIKDSARAKQIFRNEYFLKGSDGLQDFFAAKITDEDLFVKAVFKYKDFYASSKNTLLQTTAIKGPIYKNANMFEGLYPEAVFPDMYFVIGRFASGGTISDNGLLIGTEQMGKMPETDTSVRKDWQHKSVMNLGRIPITVAHELVYFNQGAMKRESTLLCYAMIEGSAEFLTELITGSTDGDYTAFKGREQQIWHDFKNERSKDLYAEWLDEQPKKRPRDGMHWAGYLICKSYYDSASDKKQAIYDILHIQDYQAFFEKSEVENYIKALN
jgi:hypothetical protein